MFACKVISEEEDRGAGAVRKTTPRPSTPAIFFVLHSWPAQCLENVHLPLPSGSELATDLILGGLRVNEILPVVDSRGGVDELWQDRGPARPCLLVLEEDFPAFDL